MILKHNPDKEDRDTETDSETNTTDTDSDILEYIQVKLRVKMVTKTEECLIIIKSHGHDPERVDDLVEVGRTLEKEGPHQGKPRNSPDVL